MFFGCSSLTHLGDISKWNKENVTDMSNMFCNCSKLKDKFPNISKWNISKVENLGNMFYGCDELEKLDLSGWKLERVKYTNNMFANCESLESIGITNWKIDNVKFMNNMFQNCKRIDSFSSLSLWNVKNVVDMTEIFEGIDENVQKPDWYNN